MIAIGAYYLYTIYYHHGMSISFGKEIYSDGLSLRHSEIIQPLPHAILINNMKYKS